MKECVTHVKQEPPLLSNHKMIVNVFEVFLVISRQVNRPDGGHAGNGGTVISRELEVGYGDGGGLGPSVGKSESGARG